MRQFLITITLLIAVMFSVFATAAEAPDFSGTWVLNVAKSMLPKDSTIKSQAIVIENKKSAIVSITKPTARSRRKPTRLMGRNAFR